MDRVYKIVLIYIVITCVQGDIFSNFLNFITEGTPSGARGDNEVARRFKRITTEQGEGGGGVDFFLETQQTQQQNGIREEESSSFKRSTEEQEMEEILQHGASKNPRSVIDDSKDLRASLIGGKFEKRETLPGSEPEKTGRRESVVISETEKRENIAFQNSGKSEEATKLANSTTSGATIAVAATPVFSKFPKINSREEKEMSSIKTLSSYAFPAEQDAKKSDGRNEEGSGLDDSALNEVENWPKGRYGLPKPISGCPTSETTRWKTGFRYHDTEDDGTENQRSDNFHLAANFSEDGISHEFCIKDDFEGDGEWPAGRYCIYKRGPLCPQGLDQGFVIWDDENTDNQDDKGGALPEGEYTEDTKIYFCCNDKGAKENQIALPTKKPFFLFAYKSINCQKVVNMRASSEFIKFDDEDRGNTDYEDGAYPYGIHQFQKDHMLFLCYYQPINTNKIPVLSVSAEPSYNTNLEEDMVGADGASDGGNGGGEIDQESLRQSEEMMKAFMKATGGVEDETNKQERTKAIIKTIKVPVRAKNGPLVTILGLLLGSFVIGTAIIFLTKHVNRGGGSAVNSSVMRGGHQSPSIRGVGTGGNKNRHNNSRLNHSVDAEMSWHDADGRGKFHRLPTNNDSDADDMIGIDIGDEDVYEEEEIFTKIHHNHLKNGISSDSQSSRQQQGRIIDSDEDDEDTASYYTDKEDNQEEEDLWSDLEVDDELVEDQLLPDSELKSGLELLFLKQQRHYWNQTRRHNQSRENHSDK